MVEFALVLVPLLLIVVGFMQLGVAMHAKINGTHLTAEGARYVAVNQNPGLTADPAVSMQNYIRSRASTGLLRTEAKVCIEFPPNPETGTSGKVGDPVRVTLDRPYDILATSRIADLLPDGSTLPTTMDVHNETTMRLEALPTNVDEGCTGV